MEARLKQLLTGIAATATFALFVSAAQADCVGNHNVTASAPASQKGVAMSTYDGPPPTVTAEDAKTAEAAASCADGNEDCKAPVRE